MVASRYGSISVWAGAGARAAAAASAGSALLTMVHMLCDTASHLSSFSPSISLTNCVVGSLDLASKIQICVVRSLSHIGRLLTTSSLDLDFSPPSSSLIDFSTALKPIFQAPSYYGVNFKKVWLILERNLHPLSKYP